MKKQVTPKLASILILIIIATSCASSLPAPESQNDTLLIVLTDKKLSGGINEIFTYYEIMTDKSDIPITITPKKEYCIVSNLPPGDYLNLTITEKDYSVSGVERVGPNVVKPKPIKLPFKLKPGYITIFPLKFTYVIKNTTNGYTYYWDIKNVTKKEEINALTDLSKKDGFSEWENDLNI